MLDFFIFCFFDLYFFFISSLATSMMYFFPGLFVVHMHAFVISSNSPCIHVFLIINLPSPTFPPPQKPPNLC